MSEFAPQPRPQTGPQSRPKIKLDDVHKRFGDNVVLDGINLEVQTGESVVIIGGSGTGKSVTLKCILGLLTPEKGTIEIDGESVVGISGDERDRINGKFGMLFQSAALFDSMSNLDNVAFGLTEGKGMDPEAAQEIALEKLRQVGLGENVARMSPAELSVGMKKRVGLARAIAIEPEIIFFDEPTTGLDPVMGDVINDLIVQCVREVGATTITITHDMASARKIADRIAMLYKGKLIWTGPTDEIDTCGEDHVEQFVHGRVEGPIQMELRRL